MDVIHGPFKTELLLDKNAKAFVSVTKGGNFQSAEGKSGRWIQIFRIFLERAFGQSCQGHWTLTGVFWEIVLYSLELFI